MRRLRALSEAECYFRCYGERDEMVRIVEAEAREPTPGELLTSGEHLRRLFEERLDARETEPEAA
jgi:hypothetical protein